IGVGKGTVALDDFERADAIFIIGQNPGTNHPRMLTTLLEAKRRGARIVSINPLKERALVRFTHPQDVLGLLGRGTEISDLYLQVRVGGDIALLKGIMKEVLAAEERAPGGILGKPGAGVCPVRGHSNVQGDRTMGIWETPKPEFLQKLGAEFHFAPPREPGLDTVAAIRAMHEGRAKVFCAMGGNFVVATPDTAYT